MSKSKPVTMLVTYRPKMGKDKQLLALVKKHWGILDRVGLVTKERAKIWKATDKRSGGVSFVEMFQWKNGEASGIAHQTPEVMAMWEPMGLVLEELQLSMIEPIAPRRA
ncbi:MAG: hypothetical protein HYR85_24125 [Planctomycetes bacterium]|nr:hypothetical protein [Planctomycetota bacterium]MBI3847226.1 hypothetical protein [Planctomycetota bacterium]